jgi:DNA-binding MarR family transcriptional regulator
VKIAMAHDLRPPAFGTLRALDEPKTMSELAGALHCDNSNVTGLIDRLAERGLVERQAAEHDRRVTLLVLTPKGRRLRAEMMETMAEPPEWLERLPDRDQRTLLRIFKRALFEPDQESPRHRPAHGRGGRARRTGGRPRRSRGSSGGG